MSDVALCCVGQCCWADMVCRLHESVHCLTGAAGEVDTPYVWGSDVRVSLHVTVSFSILKHAHVLNMLLGDIDLLVLILRFDIPPVVCCVGMAVD